MDVSGLVLIPFAAMLTTCWMLGAAILSKHSPGFRGPFLLSYGLGAIFMEPWRIATWQELGMFTVMLLLLALWVAGGCIIGGIPAVLIVSLARKLRRRLGH
jgi:hypothetical protein